MAVSVIAAVEEARGQDAAVRRFALALLSAVALLLFALHSAEIALFALFYLAVGALPGLEEALYVSATAYSTIGASEFQLPPDWRLLVAIEGVIGFLMLGWSAAFFVTDMNKLLRQ